MGDVNFWLDSSTDSYLWWCRAKLQERCESDTTLTFLFYQEKIEAANLNLRDVN